MYIYIYIYIIHIYTYTYIHIYIYIHINWYTGLIWFLPCLDNIHDQLHAITENLQVLLAEVRSKLQDSVVVSVEGGMVVDRSLRKFQVADVVHKVFKCLICHALMTLPISVATCCKQVLGCGTCVESWLVNHYSCHPCPQFSWPVAVSYLKK